MRKKTIMILLIGLSFLAATNMVKAVQILGGNTYVANSGEVTAKFLGSSAAYTNVLYLYSPLNNDRFIFNNKTTPIGSTISLGTFTAGEELIFKISVLNTANNFYSGDHALMNPDKKLHSMVDFDFAPNEIYIGFEDLYGGGDNDFNDVMFSFSNVTSSLPASTDIPEPSILLLFFIGAICLSQFHYARLST